MATNLTALQTAIKLIADATTDSIKAAGDSTTAAKIAEYENLLSDVIALIPQIGDIPTEASALAPADYATLVANLATDLALPAGSKLENIVNASVQIISTVATTVVPQVEALIAAVKA
jgi:hypothetical protein